MACNAVVCDLDGTLVDTEDSYITAVFGKTLKGFGVSLPDVQNVASRFWKGWEDRDVLITRLGVDTGQFWAKFKELDVLNHRIAHSFAYGDSWVLDLLRGEGIKTGVVTDAPHYIAEREIALTGHSFDDVVSFDLSKGIPAKPNATGLLVCLANLGVSPQDAIYVGNANVDVLVARNAGVKSAILARDGYRIEEKPDFAFRDLVEFRAGVFR